MKYNGTSWETVGTVGFSAGQASYPSLALDVSGTPYVAYSDGAYSGKATVMKYNGTSWVTVGTSGFSAGSATYLSLAIMGDGNPYVAFRDGYRSAMATLMGYNGTSWGTMGASGLSTGAVFYVSLAFNGNIPYVAYMDLANLDKATVKKYDGASWVAVGSALSNDIASYISLAIDGNGTPYVACRDGNNGTLTKYTGSSWQGVPDFSVGNVSSYISLAIDGNGTPYVAYQDGGNGSKATVMKFSTPAVAPTVTTASIATYDASSATVGGNITNNGGAIVTARGVLYSSTNVTPTVGGTGVTQDANGTGSGAFSKTISGLSANTTYHVRAYATNSVGTSYGSVQSFKTKTSPVISWSTPADIVYGTALSASQLNATADVPGTFVYSPVLGTVLNVGTQALTATFTPTDAVNYSTATKTVNLTVNKATPVISWSTPADIVYGTALSASQLNATADVPGTFAYSPALGTVLTAGVQALTATFTPTDAVNYSTAAKSVNLTVNKATPVISWSTPADIVYGTALSASQLNATANVAGTFAYSPVLGTVLNVGTQALTATFTPTDAVNYSTATKSVNLTVNKATPVISWSTPADIVYGTVLSASQLNATADVPGTFVYSPVLGTVLTAGVQALTVTFTPTDAVNYSTATKTVNLTVNKATPVISWSTPAEIVYGTALSGTQLNATANVAGTFAYSPALGTVLNAGSGQVLTVTFTPTDAVNYSTATKSVNLTVNKATPVISWSTPADIVYGTALSASQLNATSNVPGTFAYSPVLGTVLTVGSQTLTVTFTPTDVTNYGTATKTVNLTVNKTTPVISWSTPTDIVYGTALSASQLNATSNVPGTFVYNPVLSTVLTAGTQALTVTFTPTDVTNYGTATKSVNLTVNKGTPVISWSTPADIVYGTALSASQLNATANVAGTFAYSPVLGTVLNVGTQALTVTFTPTDVTNYGTATKTVNLTVNKATPVISWSTPTDIVYGTALSASQLNATANVAGTFAYSPVLGTVLTAGVQTLTVTFTPTDAVNYGTATKSVNLTVNKATPVISWSTPADIVYGTALSASQLNATANVAGTFAYSPVLGTVLNVGSWQVLTLTFTPTDASNYDTATKTVNLTVNVKIAGDTNGDGKITAPEIAGDTNGDGKITSPEIAGDTNGDGKITSPEIAGDTNGDGKIDGTEIAGDKDGDGKITSPEIAGDTNGDGKITAPEIAGDTNGDGKIDGTEIAGDKDGDGKITVPEIAGDTNGDGKIDGPEIAGDKDGDGKITSPEIAGDTNGDGKIDGTEIAGDTNGGGKIDGTEIAGDTDGDGKITAPEIAGDTNGDGKIDGTELAGDTNGDGKITAPEIVGDTNGDGKIDGTELAGDTNGDGKITSPEIAGDTNGDGKIDGAELAGDTNGDGKIIAPEIAGDTNGDGKIDGTEIAGDTDGDGKITAPEIAGDTNGDGKIDGTEITGDTNGDGKITSPEIAGDTNGDGKITSPEIAGDTDGDGKITSPEIAGDTNGDGKIDGSEIAGDTNGDGKITSPEIAGDTNGDGKIDGTEITGDTNGDGKITFPEIAGDTDGDGKITAPEIAGDTDGDGKITAPEIAGDINGDGKITSPEIAGDTDGDGKIGTGEIAGNTGNAGTTTIAGDTNGDGKIDGTEIAGDTNGDGKITAPEIAGDTNGDGKIDGSEIAGDKDGDGKITAPEIAGDTDGDGKITAPEIAGDKDGDGKIDGSEIAGDTNGDGKITSPEIAGDTNGDGKIDGSEIAGDKDGDGKITAPEIAGDTDGDGKITSPEIAGDKDGDGKITAPEIAGDTDGDGKIVFPEIAGDKDGDGKIDGTEVDGSVITIDLATPSTTPIVGCTGSGFDLSYTVSSGAPTQYKITYDAAALAAGIQNVSYTNLPSSGTSALVSVTIPTGTKFGTYHGALQMKNESGVESPVYDFQFTVNVSAGYIIHKFDDVVLCDNSSHLFTAYQWYKNGEAISGATKQFYSDPSGLVGSYSLKVTTVDGQVLYSCNKYLNIPLAQKVTAYPSKIVGNQVLTVKVSGMMDEDLEGATLSVYTMQGVRVYRSTEVKISNSVTLPSIDGMYLGRVITSTGKEFQFKVIVAK